MIRISTRCVAATVAALLASTAVSVENDAARSGVSGRSVGERGGPHDDETFTRMFPGLESFAARTPLTRGVVQQVGQKGGPLDALDDLSDPVRSITEPATFSPRNPDNPSLAAGGNSTAGMTFLGQFLDHDITLDLRSQLQRNAEPERTHNFRTAAFDLDSLYGDGPSGSPELYEADGTTLRVESIPGAPAVSRGGAARWDLPRGPDGAAIVADARNDENVIVSQLHVAMLRFHNAVVERVNADAAHARATPAQRFAIAQRLVRWHYQWIIVHEFLPSILGAERVAALLRDGPRFYDVESSRRRGGGDGRDGRGGRDDTRRDPKIPVEFSVAAFRFGHSQVRPSYRLNFGASPQSGGAPFFALVFDAAADAGDPDPADLRGGRRAPRRFIDWQTFFDFGDGNVRPNKSIDARLSTPLMDLPGLRGPATALPSDGVQSLASRNLLRHVTFGLPSGQDVARRIGAPVLDATQLEALRAFDLQASTPLWLYVLHEAERLEQGRRLGPVGATIVGEVFVGLLRADRDAWLAAEPGWRPTLPSARPGRFAMTDLLRLAGVVPPLQ